MKTPLTVTASAWNYCQNSCPYCVSGSNLPKWKFEGNFSHIPQIDILDFDCLIKWQQKYVPLSELHISGGECLLRPDIEIQIEKLVRADIPTTIFTNGLLISKRRDLVDMPLKWHVTHHSCNSFDRWRDNVELIRKRHHIACRVMHVPRNGPAIDFPAIEKQYHGLNFHWARCNGLKEGPWKPRKEDLKRIASECIHLIVPDGRVYACNSVRHPPIGHIDRGTYSPGLARRWDREAGSCASGGNCPAYQTALWLSRGVNAAL